MIPELGHLALVLAIATSILLVVLPLVGASRGNYQLMATARPLAAAQFWLLTVSFGCLVLAFLQNDFSVQLVAEHSNTRLPWYYQITATWGNHEGSLLLWVLTLAGWTWAVALFSQSLPRELVARVLGVMGVISLCFLLFTQMTSNPFTRILPVFPYEGNDLNPLLQDFGMIVHPPMLYMGYVGFAVVFAFVVAALLGGRLDSAWARWSRPWTTSAWCFLTLGIALGSWWAYYELGWGGWWFWDPVENASFMPWLLGTALMHSLAATEKRSVFKAWTILLAIATFSLSILGTFLVRSGVLTSVHSFATDPTRGLFLLAIMALLTGSALLLLLLRASTIRSEGRFAPVSRESGLLVNNVLLVGACGVVFVGTLFPLVVDVLNLGKLSVGPPYFNALFAPLTLALMAALGVGPLLRWKTDDLYRLRVPLIISGIISVTLGFGLTYFLLTPFYWLVALSLSLVFWIVCTELEDIRGRIHNKHHRWQALLNLPRHYKGMVLGHLGLAVTVTGIAMVSFYDIAEDVRLAEDRSAVGAGHEFRMVELYDYQGPNFTATRAVVEVYRDGRQITVMRPEKRFYVARQMPMTQVALSPGLVRDLYLALGEPLDDGSWAVRVQYKPFVRWIWLGALIMSIGGFLAISDPRYRLARRRRTATVTGEQHVAKT